MRAAVQCGDGRVVGGITDVAELYEDRAGQVRRLVRHEVRAPEPVIEDACQFAWSRLVHHRDRVHRDTAVAWLVSTAIREAFKLIRRGNRDLSLEGLLDQGGDVPGAAAALTPEEIVEHRARLEALRSLPERQRRLVWLQGIGLSYAEMADHTGATERTVERQLLRARRKLRVGDATNRQ
jgi:RNA polymerase sigma factor (sigma-70 family)